jgi:hypothetical protein
MTIALAKNVEDFLREQVRAGVAADPSELANVERQFDWYLAKAGGDIVMRRTMRGQRDLPRKLLEAPSPQ